MIPRIIGRLELIAGHDVRVGEHLVGLLRAADGHAVDEQLWRLTPWLNPV